MTLLAASSGVAETLLDLFLILVAAKIGDEIFKRIHQPALIGEILAGLVVGPAVLGWVELSETVEVFAELGAVFLLFWIGLETKLDELKDVGMTAGTVGVLGVALPFAGGAASLRGSARTARSSSSWAQPSSQRVSASRPPCSRSTGSSRLQPAGRSWAQRSWTTFSQC